MKDVLKPCRNSCVVLWNLRTRVFHVHQSADNLLSVAACFRIHQITLILTVPPAIRTLLYLFEIREICSNFVYEILHTWQIVSSTAPLLYRMRANIFSSCRAWSSSAESVFWSASHLRSLFLIPQSSSAIPIGRDASAGSGHLLLQRWRSSCRS